MTWSHRILCCICVFCSEFPDFDMWTATQTSQLTLTPNSSSERMIRWPSQSSENPPFSSDARCSCEVWRNKSTCASDCCAPAACSTLPSVVPVRTELHTVRRRGAEERRWEARRRREETRGEGGSSVTRAHRERVKGKVSGFKCHPAIYWSVENQQETCAVSLDSPSLKKDQILKMISISHMFCK